MPGKGGWPSTAGWGDIVTSNGPLARWESGMSGFLKKTTL